MGKKKCQRFRVKRTKPISVSNGSRRSPTRLDPDVLPPDRKYIRFYHAETTRLPRQIPTDRHRGFRRMLTFSRRSVSVRAKADSTLLPTFDQPRSFTRSKSIRSQCPTTNHHYSNMTIHVNREFQINFRNSQMRVNADTPAASNSIQIYVRSYQFTRF